MSFPPTVKEDILVASARHCCVCHRYKGVKIEIHHITPKEKGGPDTFENAIPLCFDCHADAGHYFAKHPKGTKFSPAELVKHKASWFKIVADGKIPTKDVSLLHCRYLITKNFSVVNAIKKGDFIKFPIPNSVLFNTRPNNINYLSKGESDRVEEIEHQTSLSIEEYEKIHPDLQEIPQKKDEHNFYLHKRTPTINDIKDICNDDYISQYLLRNKVEPERIAKIYTRYESDCGDSSNFNEVYKLRPAYFKYLVLTNISDKHIRINKLITLIGNEPLFNEEAFNKTEQNINFPDILIEPNKSIIVPLGLFLTDFEDMVEDLITHEEIPGDETITLKHGQISSNNDIQYVNENFLPLSIDYDIEGQQILQDIHSFDFNNLYIIDSFWNCGSCPHLFFETSENQLKYQGEIFNKQPNLQSCELIIIKEGVKSIIIAELEQEVTVIKSIKINSNLHYCDLILRQGENLKINVNHGDLIEIIGYYQLLSENHKILSTSKKKSMISQYKLNYA